MIVFLFCWARWELEAGQSCRTSGDLDRLLTRKRDGSFMPPSRWLRTAAKPAARFLLVGNPAQDESQAEDTPPMTVLERLVQSKRRRVWLPSPLQAGDTNVAHDG
jgi:hypothetical protein